MRKVYKSIEEVKAAFPDAHIHEYESFFMVENGKTVSVLPKALSREMIYTTMCANGFPEKLSRRLEKQRREASSLTASPVWENQSHAHGRSQNSSSTEKFQALSISRA
jgi:hypothetical protein